jgi:hypothetical protein
MDRLRLGLVLLALAPLTWIVGAVATDTFALDLAGPYSSLSLVLLLVALSLAAWAVPDDRRWASTVAFALGASAIAWFYAFDLVTGEAAQAGGLFVLGCLVAAVGTAMEKASVLAVGLAIAALGGAYWVYVDGILADDGGVWVPGDLLTAIGGAVGAWGAWTRETL